MSQYLVKYAQAFEETTKKLTINRKIKRMLRKAILFILEKPYSRAKKVKEYSGESIFRKNVCAGKFRIFYRINEKSKTVEFYFLRIKNKKTYKNL